MIVPVNNTRERSVKFIVRGIYLFCRFFEIEPTHSMLVHAG